MKLYEIEKRVFLLLGENSRIETLRMIGPTQQVHWYSLGAKPPNLGPIGISCRYFTYERNCWDPFSHMYIYQHGDECSLRERTQILNQNLQGFTDPDLIVFENLTKPPFDTEALVGFCTATAQDSDTNFLLLDPSRSLFPSKVQVHPHECFSKN